jgi:hypothetical protein
MKVEISTWLVRGGRVSVASSMPTEATPILPTAAEWMFLGGALLVTLPLIFLVRYLLRELRKEDERS